MSLIEAQSRKNRIEKPKICRIVAQDRLPHQTDAGPDETNRTISHKIQTNYPCDRHV